MSIPYTATPAGPSSSISTASTARTRPSFHWTPTDSNMSNSQSNKPTRSLRGTPALVTVYEPQPSTSRRIDPLDEKSPDSRSQSQSQPQSLHLHDSPSSISNSSWQEKPGSYHDESECGVDSVDLPGGADSSSRPSASSHRSRTHSAPSASVHPHELIDHQRHYGHRVKGARSCGIPAKLKPWLPMCAWFATTIGFIIALAFWKKQVFQGLDDLSSYLKRETYFGQAVLFSLILITTFPPLPLYSTFMMLAGYTFGAATAFFISYFASLLGALIVFLIFRHFVPGNVAASLLPPSLKRVVRAIEHRPSIFLLIRVAPYPYNVLNAVLGSCSTMPLSRYIGTTAISLLKVIAHTSLGSTIRSFKDFHAAESDPDPNAKKEISWGEIWTGFGVFLCVVLFIYLAFVARKAVDEECEDDESTDGNGYSALPTTASPPQMTTVVPSVAASANPFVVESESELTSPVSTPRRTSIPLITTSPPSRRASVEDAV